MALPKIWKLRLATMMFRHLYAEALIFRVLMTWEICFSSKPNLKKNFAMHETLMKHGN